ncbi:MAG: hypothetical protein ACPGSN_05775, partial [Psychrobium sp.]
MAQAQQSLLPDSEVSIKIPFKETKDTNLVQDAITDVELEAQEAANDVHEPTTAQPNDYVHGTHNIITPKTNDDDKASA